MIECLQSDLADFPLRVVQLTACLRLLRSFI
jgi:hypothetical protein